MKTLRMMTDEELVVLYAEGNNAAFDVLLNRYKSSIHSYIYFIVHNKDLTEDIFQETFVKVIMTIKQGRYTENGKFKAWITRIAHNLIIDNFRQERSENTVSNDEVEVDLFNNIKLCDGTIEDNIVRRQVLSDVKKLVKHLPDSQREVLEMRYYQDLSFKEIADITGEQTKLDLSDEPKTEKKKKPEKINTAIKNLDRKYSNPVKMPVTPPPQAASAVKDEPEMEPEVETTVVDLDELLQEQNKVVEQAAEPENEEEENTALEEFLSAYNFDDEASEEEDEKESFNEELYDKCINDKNLEFSKDDVERIETLINSEISDDAMRNASEFLESSEKDKKPSPLELLEKFVTVYAVQQNVSFTKDDVDALNKLINVEIDNSFITDLRTDPDRMREMQDEIAKQKSKPHKTSELLTLNVKDMLPDLSEALKKQGGRRIESEVKPQVVYFSEGYDVSTLKLNDALPDLSKEIDNDEAYKARPSDEIELVDTSYEVQKMSISGELPDLTDVLKNPEKYETPEPEPEEVDEEALLRNITNVTFKPFDDGTREFEVLNDFDDSNAPSVSDMQEEFNQLGDNFEIINQEEEIPLAEENDNDDFEALYDNNNYVDLDKDLEGISEDDAVLEEPSDAAKLLEMIKDMEEKKKSKEAAPKPEVKPAEKPEIKKEKPINAPEFCILDGERFSILNVSYFTDKMGCYLAKNEQGYCIIGFVGDRVFKIKHYEKLNVEKLQSRISEKLDDGTVRYIVRIGIHKFIMNVKKDDMEFVMDLC